MKKTLLKYYLITIGLTLTAMLELIQNASYLFFFLCFCILIGMVGLILKKGYGKRLLTISFAIITSWIIYYLIYQSQSQSAYNKIKSIPKDQLLLFTKTNDIKSIPESKRYTWIGLFPQRIKVIDHDRISKINAVGWEGNSIFGYYDIGEDRYVTSIK